MSLIATTNGVQHSHLRFAFPNLLCSVCQQASGDNRRECDSCHAIACQICARTEWEWKESSHDLRHKCRDCKKKTVTSSIVQQCLDQAQNATATNPALSTALYEFILPWLPKDRKVIIEKRKNECRALAESQRKSLDAVIHILEQRAQDNLNCSQYDTALELWSILYEIRPDDEHVCTMMVKTQVWGHDLEQTDKSQQVERALEFIRIKLNDAFETECYQLAVVLCDLALKLDPNDTHLTRKLTEAELKRSEQLERFQPSPVAVIKATLQLELDAARDQGDAEREASLMKVLEATLKQEQLHYQSLDRQQII